MKTNRIKSLALIFSGVVIGCGAAATVGASWAGPTPGKWSCYQAWDFPDVTLHEGVSSGMNKVASSAPVGTTIVMKSAGGNGIEVLCVRD
jgi:hypothetical protein